MKRSSFLTIIFLLLSNLFFGQTANYYEMFSTVSAQKDADVVRNKIERIYKDSTGRDIKKLNAAITVLKESGKNEQAALLLFLSGKQEFNVLGDTTTALKKYREAYTIFSSLNNERFKNRTLRYMAEVYSESDIMDKALSMFINVVNHTDDFPEEKFFALSQIGALFKKNGNAAKSFEYFTKASVIYLGLSHNDEDIEYRINSNYRQVGVLYRDKKQYDSAEKYFKLSINGAERLNNAALLASNYNSLGLLYEHTGQDQKALAEYLKSIDLKRKIKGKEMGLATSLANTASTYLRLKQYNLAEKYILEAVKLSSGNHDKTSRLSVLRTYRDFLVKVNDKKNLTECYEEIIKIQDALYKRDVTEQTAKMEAVFQNEKKSKEIAEANIKNVGLQKDLDYKDRERKIFIIGTILLLALLGVATKMYLEVRKGNKKLNLKNEEVLQQKQIVEHQNKEIIDSINYAQKIQRAILPQETEFKDVIGDSFVLFRPKDIVSGDFYWCSEKSGHIFYATVDCTGHGVPGGFMSMLATSLLTEIIIEKATLEPSEILSSLREKIISALKQKGVAGENKDGMDMSICRLNKERNELTVGMANNPVWIKRGNELIVLKADKIPVGFSHSMELKFTQQYFKLQKNDVIYSFTDGYADQFGGPKGKKFKYKQLEEVLSSLSDQSMEQQKLILEKRFDSWKGNLEQLDDVCVIGVKV